MFTGIIEERGEITAVEPSGDGVRVTVRGPRAVSDASHGDSIAVSGVCLTVVDQGEDWFTADVMRQSLDMSTLGALTPGSPVNLERALRIGDELGGHLVAGHVDGVATVVSATPENASVRWRFRLPEALARYVAPKGSVAIDGVSLTVNEVDAEVFGVNIIPHTASVTTFGTLQPGDKVNIEVDMMARYVARLREYER